VTTTDEIKKDTELKMKKTVEATMREFGTVRTGRAQTSLVEGVSVDYYGTPMPLKQLANLTTPEPRTIVVNPWDKTAIGEIEKAILKANIGLTPTNDGKIVRIIVPQLTKERREELKKIIKQINEGGKVSLRTARRVANEHIDKLEKEKKITEDDKFSSKEDVQKMTERFEKELDKHLADKDKELSEV